MANEKQTPAPTVAFKYLVNNQSLEIMPYLPDESRPLPLGFSLFETQPAAIAHCKQVFEERMARYEKEMSSGNKK